MRRAHECTPEMLEKCNPCYFTVHTHFYMENYSIVPGYSIGIILVPVVLPHFDCVAFFGNVPDINNIGYKVLYIDRCAHST